MHSDEIRSRFLKFFENRGHKIIHSASLVPENDPSVLFNTAGMQPLVPYLLGQDHPMGKRIADIQKCVRTGDLDSIGDNRHFSFFEMMGNWSLGDPASTSTSLGGSASPSLGGYFKKEAIMWSYEFLTSTTEGLGLDPTRLYVTIFEGDENAPMDKESKDIWMGLGIPENRIYALPADDNWWSPGDNGPCGPCSEMFYDMTDGVVGDLTKEEFINAVQAEEVIEIWNDVFMEYTKKEGKVVGRLAQSNVDTGAGLERMTAVMQGKKTAYDTDLFESLIKKISELSELKDDNFETTKLKRIIADHIRTSIFLIADGVVPSGTGQGYILRRLLRRAIRSGHALTMNFNCNELFKIVENKYSNIYPNITENREKIILELEKEYNQFIKTLKHGLHELEKRFDNRFELIGTGENLFELFTTYGFPIELSIEEIEKIYARKNLPPMSISWKGGMMFDFEKKMKEHQNLSKTASAGMFKGGLANHNENTIKLHTAHHLLLAALQEVLGEEVKQRGSNITEERLRIDFTFNRKMKDEEKQKVENIVNDKIKAGLNVIRREMPLAEAEQIGAQMEFGTKYPDIVSVYFIEDANGNACSKEFCGGPHVSNTSELGHFKIQKEEASSQGIRRIKAILE